MADVTNVESEPVSNNALVQMDFDSFETMTGIICKYVLGEMVLEWDVWILFLTMFLMVWSLWRSVWFFWEEPSFWQLNFDMHDSSECPCDNQFSQSLFVSANSFCSSEDFFKNPEQFISPWLLWHNQHLILLCGFYSSFPLPLSFFSLVSLLDAGH